MPEYRAQAAYHSRALYRFAEVMMMPLIGLYCGDAAYCISRYMLMHFYLRFLAMLYKIYLFRPTACTYLPWHDILSAFYQASSASHRHLQARLPKWLKKMIDKIDFTLMWSASLLYWNFTPHATRAKSRHSPTDIIVLHYQNGIDINSSTQHDIFHNRDAQLIRSNYRHQAN